MNKLAISIQKINEGKQNLDDLGLSKTERTALQAIDDLIRLSPQDLALLLSQQIDPSEWIVPPIHPQDNLQI